MSENTTVAKLSDSQLQLLFEQAVPNAMEAVRRFIHSIEEHSPEDFEEDFPKLHAAGVTLYDVYEWVDAIRKGDDKHVIAAFHRALIERSKQLRQEVP